MPRPLRFHWSPNPNGNGSDTAQFIRTCRDAEAAGIESVHVPVRVPLSDALALATEAGTRTARISFRIGWHFEGILASLFGSELRNAWYTLGGRLIVHMQLESEDPGGGDPRHACEFIANCRRLFSKSDRPRFDVEGQTAETAYAAIRQADCLWRLPHRPNQVYADALPVLHFDKEVGLLTFVIARPTREEAMEAASIVLGQAIPDPKGWITPYLWLGTVSDSPANIGVLVGSCDEVARVIVGFGSNGISQVLVREWPGRNDITDFGASVLPLVRAIESGTAN